MTLAGTADRDSFAALEHAIHGPLIGPWSAEYDAARQSFNAMIDRRPAAIAQCLDAAEVSVALRFARDRGLPIAVRGGGHSVAGSGLVDGGLVIDLRHQRRVVVDALHHRAHAGGGALWEDLDDATQAHELAVTGGTFVDTGIGGLTLGGGLGFLMGRCGLTCDNLVGAELVTADGRIAEVTPDSDAELLWALRGGGGNFGVATRLDYRLHDVGAMYGGEVIVALGDGAILRRYAEAQVWAPDELIVVLYIAHSAELGPAVAIDLAWLGPEAQGIELGRAILGPSKVVEGGFGPTTYGDIQRLAGLLPFTLRHYWKSTFVGDLTADVVAELVSLVRGRQPGRSGVLIEPLHGQARRYGFDHSCFPQREARFHVSGLAIWDDPAQDRSEIAWARRLSQRMTALGVGGSYVNYSAPDEPADRAKSVYPAAVYERLRRIKRRVDPDNVFRSNVNITPG
jgi:FAD binding domain-containing protein/berberine-like enzyme